MVPPFQPTFSPEINALVDKEVQDMIVKGAIIEVSPTQGQYMSTIFLVTKTDGGMRPVINLVPESSGSVRTLSDGRSGVSVEFSGDQRISDQIGFKRRVFHASNSSEGSKLPSLQMEGKTIPISGSSLRSVVSSPGIHLGDEYINDLLETTCIQERGIPGRHLSGESSGSGSSKDPGDDMAPRAPRVHHKLEKITSTSLSKRGVPGFHCGHSESAGHPSSGEGGQDHIDMYGSARRQGLRVANSSLFDMQAAKCLDSDTSCPVTFQIDADGKHQGFGQGAAKLRCQPDIARISIVRAEMVGVESVDLERKVFSAPRSGTGHCDHFRCQSLEMGCGMSWSDNPRPLVSDRDAAAHQCAGIQGSRVSSAILQGPMGGQPCSFTIGQHDSCLTDCENGVTAVKKVSGGDQRNMGVCLIAREHDYCSAYSGKTEHHRGLRESDLQRQQKFEAVSTGFPKSSKNVLLDRSGSLCRSTESPGPKILELETGPTGRRCRCTDSGLERDESVRLSTLHINSQGVAESPQRRNNFVPGSSSVVPTT